MSKQPLTIAPAIDRAGSRGFDESDLWLESLYFALTLGYVGNQYGIAFESYADISPRGNAASLTLRCGCELCRDDHLLPPHPVLRTYLATNEQSLTTLLWPS
jgi:hypothetical protein